MKKHPYSEIVGTKADKMKQYSKVKISLSQMMQIPNEKYQTLLVNNQKITLPNLLLQITKMMLISLLIDLLLDQSN